MLENELRKFGLSDKEARVYLSSLQLGKSPVQEIARQARVNRATTYIIIDSLTKKGLMTSFDQGKKTYFTAESPERLLSQIRVMEQELREKEREFSRYLPDLMGLYESADNKPKVKYYEGVEGLKAVQEEYLKVKSKKIYNISNIDDFFGTIPTVLNDYVPRRIKKGISSKLIYISKIGPNEKIETNPNELRESRFIPFEEVPFEADITIFDDKISLESFDGKIVAVLIESKVIAKSMKAIFDYLWKK